MSENTKIDWCDATINSSNGCLNRESGLCPLGNNCYAARMMKRFPKRYPGGMSNPTIITHKITDPLILKKPSRIFINSMGDTFGKWQKPEYIAALLETAERTPHHRYLFLTKDPDNMNDMLHGWQWREERNIPWNCWFGTTVTSDDDAYKIDLLCNSGGMTRNLFLSIEPYWGGLSKANFRGIPWIIVGAQTPVRKTKFPLSDWYALGRTLLSLIPRPAIFLKGSMKKALGVEHVRQDFPKGLHRRLVGEGGAWF